MKRIAHLLWMVTVLAATPAAAQTFLECADVSQDGALNVVDMITMIEEHRGGEPLPEGTGDIDFRQGYNLGDLRYLVGGDVIFQLTGKLRAIANLQYQTRDSDLNTAEYDEISSFIGVVYGYGNLERTRGTSRLAR